MSAWSRRTFPYGFLAPSRERYLRAGVLDETTLYLGDHAEHPSTVGTTFPISPRVET
jgi:hypothetical protein